MGLALKQAGTPKPEIAQATDKAASMLALDALMERRPAELSGGQRQRVAIGRAIVRRPKLFLFDEPLSNLDAALRVQTRIEIARLHRDLGATMIYVTHDQVEAMTLADKIVVLRAGRVEQVGRPMQLYNDPANTFVAGFIGSPADEFLNGGRLGLQSDQLGIRPEHMGIEHGTLAGRRQRPLAASAMSKAGRRDAGLCPYAGSRAADGAHVRRTSYTVDEAVGMGLDAGRVFHFDAQGRRLR